MDKSNLDYIDVKKLSKKIDSNKKAIETAIAKIIPLRKEGRKLRELGRLAGIVEESKIGKANKKRAGKKGTAKK